RGAIFVDEETEVPEGATVVYSAHGVAPTVHENSARLRHTVIDATCPLVTKVHAQAKRYARDGYTIILIGHAGHEEVVGTMGEARRGSPGPAARAARRSGRGRSSRRGARRSPTPRRGRFGWRRRRTSPPRSAPAPRRPGVQRRRTSATRPPTANGPSRRCSPR